MNLTTAQVSALAAASSPEDAYKIFAGAATQLIGQAVADALAKTLGAASASTASVAAVSGWEQFVKGANLSMVWGTPGISVPPTILNSFANSSIPAPTAPHMLGVGFSIGITGTF